MMTDFYEIPLRDGAQEFTVTLGKRTFRFGVNFRLANEGTWYLDIEVLGSGIAVYGVPLVTGTDLFEQLQHLGIGHLYALVNGRSDLPITYENLGTNVGLYWSE